LNSKSLYDRLIRSYSEKNLTHITTQLISLYREKHYDALREVMATVTEFTGIREEKIQRCFAYLLKLYHPDKTSYYINYIREHYHGGNFDRLDNLTHIFHIEEMEFATMRSINIDEDIDFHPDEVWDESDPGFSYFDEDSMNLSDDLPGANMEEPGEDDFLSAVKRKIYGNMEIDLPVYLLEDLEDIEMAEYEILSLDGIRFCKYAVTMDLSGNHINDLSEISECRQLKELYLSNNQISIIDAISNLGELTQLDLSYNQVDDLTPLFVLKKLEYVNLIGNPVSNKEIEILKKKGIFVVI
jgi:hypothetical protein